MALMGVSRRDGRLASRPLLWFFRTDAASASLTSLIGNERAPLCDSRRLNVQAVASRVLYRQSARHQVPQLPSHAVKPVMALDASIMSDTVQVLFTVYTSSKVLYVKPIALTCEYPART